MDQYHIPVFLEKSIDYLITDKEGVYVDVTYGGGGHSQEILNRLGVNGCLIALDRDSDSFENRIEDKRLTLLKANFRHLKKHLRAHQIKEVSGVIADLGVSSHQIDDDHRGFTFRDSDVMLDMRMATSAFLTASDILNNYSQEDLQMIFSEYGEVRNAKSLASKIIEVRKRKPIMSSTDMKEVIEDLIRGNRAKYLAQVYQALRIEVNDEMRALKELLVQCGEVICKNGRLVVISYHSLEDRIVKRYLRNGGWDMQKLNNRKEFKEIEKKIIVPEEKEININSRSRSAKMRIGEKIK